MAEEEQRRILRSDYILLRFGTVALVLIVAALVVVCLVIIATNI